MSAPTVGEIPGAGYAPTYANIPDLSRAIRWLRHERLPPLSIRERCTPEMPLTLIGSLVRALGKAELSVCAYSAVRLASRGNSAVGCAQSPLYIPGGIAHGRRNTR
jgi:hypothetical protein